MDEEGLVSPTESCSALGIEMDGVFGAELSAVEGGGGNRGALEVGRPGSSLSVVSKGELAEGVESEGGGWEKERGESEYWG